MTWSPVLRGPAAERARAAIDAIAETLRDPDPAWRVGPSLANGDAGLAVLYAYLGDHELASRFADRAVDAIAEAPMAPALYHGFTGVAWATEHLIGRVLDPGGEDLNAAIDDALLAALQSPIADPDLMNGLVGFGVYALERAPRPASRELLAAIVAQLAAGAERGAEGVRWRTPDALLDPETVAALPDGAYNLGLAHGMPGVVALLSACVASEVPAARELLGEAVRWLLSQQLPDGLVGRFADFAGLPASARLGWCYGDLSVATALVLAGHRAERSEWTARGLELARGAAARPADTTGVRDACLCHGAAGLGLMFARLARSAAMPEPVLDAAATRWFEAAVDLRQPGGPVAGFAPFVVDASLALGDAAVGVLTGAAGVALALHAATTADDPAWDRALLLSLR